MPRHRSKRRCAATTVKRCESAGGVDGHGGGAPVVQLGKRSSDVLLSTNLSYEDDSEQQQLVKKFRSEFRINEEECSARRLKNITNTVDHQQKQQMSGEETGTKRKNPVGGEALGESKRAKQRDVDAIADGEHKLRNVLGRHYFEVNHRINLEHIPFCLKNAERCARLHARRKNQAKKVNQRIQQDTKEMLVENRPLQFLDHLDQALLRNEFIEAPLFVKALELILTITEPSDQLNANYSVRTVLLQTVDVLDRTIDHFPPCWLDLKRAYLGVVFGVLEESCFARYDRSEGLLKVILFLLEQSVECKASQDGTSLCKTLSNNERSLANFYLWEQENTQKYDFDLLTREDKLDRLFLVLQILVKILEYDLVMWILRHPHNAKENMFNSSRMPLIAVLLWNENSTVGEINPLIKRIIVLYVNVCAVHYPKTAIQTLSRLLSIIGTAINLTEIQYDGSVEYPCIKQKTNYFAQQIMRQLEISDYFSVSLCLRAIEQMRSPLLRMLLAGELLQKHTPLTINIPSAASYLKHLVKGDWKAFPKDNPPEAVSPAGRDRFPLLNHQQQRQSVQEIGRTQYVNLLLIAFQAYMQVYPLKTYFQGLKPPPEPAQIASTSYAPNSRTAKNHHSMDALEKGHCSQVQQLESCRTRLIRRSTDGSVGGLDPLVLEEISVTPSLLLHYREEVKHLLLMKRWMQTKTGARDEEREMWAPWRSYLSTIDETLVCE
ncbi:uncharacterized protein LOC134209498 [Armigeres subalbatus]|uniref:uncharacterized protein LOC134209498 n=1 Tax=Armigeres subalbatus TaxID=124917 RepID=UPI002ED5522B